MSVAPRVDTSMTESSDEGASVLDFSPFESDLQYISWCFRQSNFVARDELPVIVRNVYYGHEALRKMSEAECAVKLAKCKKAVNAMVNFFPLIAPVTYTDAASGKKLAWVGCGWILADKKEREKGWMDMEN